MKAPSHLDYKTNSNDTKALCIA